VVVVSLSVLPSSLFFCLVSAILYESWLKAVSQRRKRGEYVNVAAAHQWPRRMKAGVSLGENGVACQQLAAGSNNGGGSQYRGESQLSAIINGERRII
jgi:hypothetical protein